MEPRIIYVRRDAADFLPPHMLKLASVANLLQDLVAKGLLMGDTIGWHEHVYRDGTVVWDQHLEFVPLMRSLLNRQGGKAAISAVLPWLIDNGYLERTNHFGKGAHAYGYTFGEKLTDLPNSRIQLSDPSILRRLKKMERNWSKNWTAAEFHLRRWLPMIQLNTTAMRLIAKDHPKADHRHMIIDMLEHGQHNCKVCHYGRFHSIFTRLPREFRDCLSYMGQPLHNVDIANSQPLFLALAIIDQFFPGSTPKQRPGGVATGPEADGTTSIWCQDGSGNHRKSIPHQDLSQESGLPSLLHSEARRRLPEDLACYLDLCTSGRLYEHLMSRTSWLGTKSEWKDQVWFLYLFGPNRTPADCRNNQRLALLEPLLQVIADDFPTLDRCIRRCKKRNYRTLSRRMQRTESNLVIRGIGGRLAREYRHVPVITIHDSIMTTPEFVPLVQDLMLAEFAALGVRPTLNVTQYGWPGHHEAAA